MVFGKLKYFDGTSKWSFPFNGIGAVLNRVYIDICSTFLLGDIILISFRYIDHHMFTFLIFVTFIYKWLYTIAHTFEIVTNVIVFFSHAIVLEIDRKLLFG